MHCMGTTNLFCLYFFQGSGFVKIIYNLLTLFHFTLHICFKYSFCFQRIIYSDFTYHFCFRIKRSYEMTIIILPYSHTLVSTKSVLHFIPALYCEMLTFRPFGCTSSVVRGLSSVIKYFTLKLVELQTFFHKYSLPDGVPKFFIHKKRKQKMATMNITDRQFLSHVQMFDCN